MQRIAQHQPPFGVRIDDFDGLAAHGGDDVTRALRPPVGHVLDEPANAHDIGLGLAPGNRGHRTGNGAGTAHVPLHVFHTGRRFQGDTAGIEGDALADEHHRLVAFLAAHIFQREQAGGLFRAQADAQQRMHAELFHLRFVQHPDRHAERLHLGPGALHEAFGIDDVCRLGHQLTREGHALRNGGKMRPAILHRLMGTDQRHRLQAGLFMILQRGAMRVDPPAAQLGAISEVRRLFGRQPVHHQRGMLRAGGEQLRGDCAASLVEPVAAGADQQDAHRAAILIHIGGEALPGLALESRGLGGVCHHLALRNRPCASIRPAFANRKDQNVCIGGAVGGELNIDQGNVLLYIIVVLCRLDGWAGRPVPP